MQIVVLAGGLATRMRPITEAIPKALIPIGAHPFLYYQLEWFKRFGVTEVVMCIGYKGEQIREYAGDGSRFGLKIQYVDEGENLRGTAGAIRLALEQGVLAETFFVIYGDSFLPIDFRKVWDAFHKAKRPALMTVFENAGQWDASNVWFENAQIRLYDKFHRHPEASEQLRYIDYGLSVLQKDVVAKRVPSGQKCDLAELFYALSREGELAGFEVKTRFYEIGSPSGLEDFRRYIAEPKEPA